MQKNYKNKKLKKEETKYFFPEHNKTIEASSLAEATEKMKKLSEAKSKDE